VAVTISEITRAAKYGASKMYVKDPSIGREDIEQEIILYLLENPPENVAHAFVKARRSKWRVARSHVVRRERQEPMGEYQPEIGHKWGALKEMIEREEMSIIRTTSLTKTQILIVERIFSGDTPQECCDDLGLSASSFANMIRDAIVRIRREFNLAETLSVRMGRCRSKLTEEKTDRTRNCVVCDSLYVAKKVDSRFCSDSCRWKLRNMNRKMTTLRKYGGE